MRNVSCEGQGYGGNPYFSGRHLAGGHIGTTLIVPVLYSPCFDLIVLQAMGSGKILTRKKLVEDGAGCRVKGDQEKTAVKSGRQTGEAA